MQDSYGLLLGCMRYSGTRPCGGCASPILLFAACHEEMLQVSAPTLVPLTSVVLLDCGSHSHKLLRSTSEVCQAVNGTALALAVLLVYLVQLANVCSACDTCHPSTLPSHSPVLAALQQTSMPSKAGCLGY